VRIAILWTLLAIGVGVLVSMLISVWRHQVRATTPVRKAVAEYVWTMIPCLIMALCAAPAVHQVFVDLSR
jgi:heme/copper-type cytochrome/quinol oxidase subunit 2